MPTDFLLTAIQATHDAIAHEPHPDDKQTLATCLQNMLKVQAKHMSQGGNSGGPGAEGPGAQMAEAGGGYGGGSPPAGPQLANDPRMLMGG